MVLLESFCFLFLCCDWCMGEKVGEACADRQGVAGEQFVPSSWFALVWICPLHGYLCSPFHHAWQFSIGFNLEFPPVRSDLFNIGCFSASAYLSPAVPFLLTSCSSQKSLGFVVIFPSCFILGNVFCRRESVLKGWNNKAGR